MRHLIFTSTVFLAGCHGMQTEPVLVLESDSQTPVAGVHVYKKPVRGLFSAIDLGSRLRPLPKAAEGVSDANGLVTLRVPRDHRLFIMGIGSDDYEHDVRAPAPATRPADIDEVFQVRQRKRPADH